MHTPSAPRVARSLLVSLVLAALASGLVASAAQAAPPLPRKRIIVLAGLPGAGKTTLGNSLSQVTGAPRHSCGDVVRGYIKARGLPYTPQNDRKAAQHFAARPGLLARTLADTIQAAPGRLHIVDGVRSPADLRVLRERFDVRVVALKLPRAQRFSRMLARQRFAGEDTTYLKSRDRREIGLGLLHVLRAPHVRVDMSGPLAEVPSQAKALATALEASW